MSASKLLGSAAAAIVLLGASSALAKEELKSSNPWRDTEIDYEHGFSAYSLSKSADPTYNPYYVHVLTIAPQWHVGDYLVFKAKLAIEQELTDADETTKKHEVNLSDLTFDIATPGITEGFTGIKIAGGVRFFFPTSKASQATTMYLAIGPGHNVSRKFPLLEGLNIGYGARFNFAFHKFTTAQNNAPWVACGSADSPACSQFVQTGVRNMWGQLLHGPTLNFVPVNGLNIDLGFTFINSFLYGLAGEPVMGDDKDVSVRRAQWFTASIGYDVLDYLTVSLGASTVYGDLSPDGKYRTPFFNRNTQLSLGLALAIDPLIGKFQ